jgi:hypothetical protein
MAPVLGHSEMARWVGWVERQRNPSWRRPDG